MADRLPQLQDTVNQQAEHFCNAIGTIQQTSYPSKFDQTASQTPNQNPPHEDYAELFVQLLSSCANDIDTLIESLPNKDSSNELQNQSVKRLEADNQEACERLEQIARGGELMMADIQAALEDVVQYQLVMETTIKKE